MKINTIYFNNFRNIKDCNIKAKNTNVFLGKNNSGKSSVLKSIYYSINLLLNFNEVVRVVGNENYRYFKEIDSFFDPSKDQRIDKNDKEKKFESTFRIEFNLSEDELSDLKRFIDYKYEILDVLDFELVYTIDSKFNIRVKTNSNGNYSRNINKIKEICAFLQDRINIDYIPSIRTERDINDLINDLVDDQLKQLNQEDKYKEAFKIIDEAQQIKLKELSCILSEKLKTYIPDVKNIKIHQTKKRIVRDRYYLNIDDGIETSIESKGDGIKSLVALSLLQKSTEYTTNILLIDEPEAHLHSGAIKELKETISSNTKNTTIFISTHSAIFVDRNNLSKNYIVDDGTVKEVHNIMDIRNSLGISIYENLLNAELVILVEGISDRKILNHSLNLYSPEISEKLINNIIYIKNIGGTDSLKMYLDLYKGLFCDVLVILDYESQTRAKVNEYISSNLIESNNLLYVTNSAKNESEIEDLVFTDVIVKSVQKVKSIDITKNLGMYASKKWAIQLTEIMKYNHSDLALGELDMIKTEIANNILSYEDLSYLNSEGIRFIEDLSLRILGYFSK